MATILITGANRGLGLAFCAQYAAEGWQVIATCRAPDAAAELQQLASHYANLSLVALNVEDFAQVSALAETLSAQPIDVLLNNAGVYGDERGQGFGHLDYQAWSRVLTVNTLAPVKMTEAFLPHLQRGQHKLVVSISSLMGSMTDNTSGGSILYRSSKAALNAAMRSLSIELKAQGIGVLILHPGWVKTDMGGPNAPLDIPTSVSGMRAVIAHFTLQQTGQFLKYDGSVLPW